MKDYYRILQIPRSATGSEIRDAYRQRARATHPDVSGASDARAFRDVQEAWDTLGQIASRREYDNALSEAARLSHDEPIRTRANADKELFAHVVESLLNESWFGVGRNVFLHQSNSRPAIDVLLDAEEAEQGISFPLHVPVHAPCLWCGGNGREFFHPCTACDGRGFQRRHTSVRLSVPAGFTGSQVVEIPLLTRGFVDEVLLVRVRTRD